MALDLSGRAFVKQRWAARGALVAAALAVLVPLVHGGGVGLLLLLAAAVGLAVSAVALWWTLTLRGPLRWVAALVALIVPAALVALFAVTLLWSLLVSVALWAVAVVSGRYALGSTGETRVRAMRERRAPPVRRPFLIMNPRSGDGKVGRFGLKEMFTVPDVDGATMGAGLERFELNGKVIWGKTGSRPGYHTVVAATRDLSRTVVYSVDSTDAKGDGLAIAQRFAFPAFNR